MINLFIFGIIIFTIISLLTNIFIMRGKFRNFLYILIPIQLTLATFGYIAVDSVMGYATRDTSQLMIVGKKFKYVMHFMSGEDLYLVAYPYGTTEPRFFIFKGSSKADQEKLKKMAKNFNDASKKIKDGYSPEGYIEIDGEVKWNTKDYKQENPKE